MKIIIVDDNAIYREGVKFLLENFYGFEVIGEASNGAEYLKLSNKYYADITLMDIEMPEMNGIEAAKRVLNIHNELKIIAITDYHNNVYQYHLICAGFKACIFKDNFYDEFESTVNKVLDGKMNFPKNILLDEDEK